MTRVCRACLHIITDAECYNLNQSYPNSECSVLRDRCKACVPEMDLDLTTDAVLCGPCYNTFTLFYHLRLKCLETEKRLRNILRGKNYIDLGTLAQENQETVDALSNLLNDNGSVLVDRASNAPNDNDNLPNDHNEHIIKQECEAVDISVPANNFCTEVSDLDSIFGHITDTNEGIVKAPDLIYGTQDEKIGSAGQLEYKVQAPPKVNGSIGSASSSDFMECKFNRYRSKKQFRCLDCDYSTSHRINLQNHIKSHFGNKPYKCNLCGYRALQKCFLKSHMTMHSGTKPFKCNQCDYRTAYRGNLQTHLRKHTGEKPYKCDICNNSYTQSNSLNRHIKTHANAKPFKCCMCEYRTMYKNHLRNHMMLHTGEKYVCGICNKKFTDKLGLTRHMKDHDDIKL